MKSFLSKLKEISPIYLISAGVFLFGFIALVVIFMYQPSGDSADPEIVYDEEGTEEPCDHVRRIDGVCVEDDSQTDPALVGIMIENHYEARPVSGLTEASIIYEAPVEGNFNRFLAVYPADAPVSKAGPVRSARPYFLDWVSEYPEMMYMHVGGSPDALEKIVQYDLFDINEFYRGWYFWRDNTRFAPHNVYTSQTLWEKAIEDYGNKEQGTNGKEQFDAWEFEKWDECQENCVNEIETVFSGQTYSASWEYNTSTEQYERFEFDQPVIDPQTGDQVVADTIVVQYVDTEVLDNIGRLGMETIGSGDAIVFRNGFGVEGEWRKDSRKDRTRFYDFDGIDGNEIPFKAGKIWVVVMNRVDGVTFK